MLLSSYVQIQHDIRIMLNAGRESLFFFPPFSPFFCLSVLFIAIFLFFPLLFFW